MSNKVLIKSLLESFSTSHQVLNPLGRIQILSSKTHVKFQVLKSKVLVQSGPGTLLSSLQGVKLNPTTIKSQTVFLWDLIWLDFKSSGEKRLLLNDHTKDKKARINARSCIDASWFSDCHTKRLRTLCDKKHLKLVASVKHYVCGIMSVELNAPSQKALKIYVKSPKCVPV